MKFLLDAHVPPSLGPLLHERGHDTIHTSSLPSGNATHDSELRTIAIAEDRVLVTKDLDFFDEMVLRGAPPKLVLLRCGNMKKRDLIALFKSQLDEIVRALAENDLVELSMD